MYVMQNQHAATHALSTIEVLKIDLQTKERSKQIGKINEGKCFSVRSF